MQSDREANAMAVSKMAISETDIRYATDAFQFVNLKRDEFYKLWLGLATDHARAAHRDLVSTEDFKVTLQEAVGKLIEKAPATDAVPAG